MSQTRSASVKYHRYLEPELIAVFIGGLLLVIVAVIAISNSNVLSASTRMQHTATPSVIDLPVVKPDQSSSLAQTLEQIDDARVVLVGETHTRYDHHLVQLEILKHLYQKSAKLALGVEWFQQPFQQHLDDYIAGKISEKEMLHRTEYFDRWKYDYRLYQPIMQYARENNIPVIALNASRELIAALAETGPDDLPAELKAQLPSSYDWTDKDYERRLRDMFDLHPEYTGEFEDFMRSQLTWDESMAERAVDYLQQHTDTRMLVLAGSGHIMFGSGIPDRIKRRVPVELVSILVSEDFLPVTDDIADFLVLSAEQSLQPVGLVGAFLEADGRLVIIKDFSPNSAVKDAGLEKGAVIVGVNDEPVESFADFKLAIIDKKPGDSIELHYLDNAEQGNKDRKTVKLELR